MEDFLVIYTDLYVMVRVYTLDDFIPQNVITFGTWFMAQHIVYHSNLVCAHENDLYSDITIFEFCKYQSTQIGKFFS